MNLTSSLRPRMLDTAQVSRKFLENCIWYEHRDFYQVVPEDDHTHDNISYTMDQRWAKINVLLQHL